MVDTGNAPPAAPPPSSANVAVDDHATNTVIPAGAHDDAQRDVERDRLGALGELLPCGAVNRVGRLQARLLRRLGRGAHLIAQHTTLSVEGVSRRCEQTV